MANLGCFSHTRCLNNRSQQHYYLQKYIFEKCKKCSILWFEPTPLKIFVSTFYHCAKPTTIISMIIHVEQYVRYKLNYVPCLQQWTMSAVTSLATCHKKPINIVIRSWQHYIVLCKKKLHLVSRNWRKEN